MNVKKKWNDARGEGGERKSFEWKKTSLERRKESRCNSPSRGNRIVRSSKAVFNSDSWYESNSTSLSHILKIFQKNPSAQRKPARRDARVCQWPADILLKPRTTIECVDVACFSSKSFNYKTWRGDSLNPILIAHQGFYLRVRISRSLKRSKNWF